MTKRGTVNFYETVDWKKIEKVVTPGIKEYLKNVHNYLLKNISGNVLVLEVGCGTGDFIKKIAKQVEKVIGIDVSDKLIETAKNNLRGIKNISLIRADIDSTKIPRDYFDFIISMWTLPNLDNPLPFIKKMKGALKPTGTIFIDTYSEKATKDRIKQYEDYGLTISKVDKKEIVLKEGLTERIYTQKDLEDLFKKAGMNVKVIKIHELGYLCRATK